MTMHHQYMRICLGHPNDFLYISFLTIVIMMLTDFQIVFINQRLITFISFYYIVRGDDSRLGSGHVIIVCHCSHICAQLHTYHTSALATVPYPLFYVSTWAYRWYFPTGWDTQFALYFCNVRARPMVFFSTVGYFTAFPQRFFSIYYSQLRGLSIFRSVIPRETWSDSACIMQALSFPWQTSPFQ